MKRFQKVSVLLATVALLASAVGAGGVAAAKPLKDTGIRHTGPDYNNGQKLPIKPTGEKLPKINPNAPLGPAQVGDTRIWLGLDDETGAINLKLYTLRGVGVHGEVWVANNLNFPNPNMLNPLTENPEDFFTYNDCRNDGVRNVITDEQVAYLLDQFDNNIYPIEADWWSTPPDRNGNKATLPRQLPNIQGLGVNVPQSHYRGEGDNVVILVDNVRDSNFYDRDNQSNETYIAGFYWSVFDNYFDRTVMSIDAWDWIHRMTADPPHAPTTDLCTSAPARPFLYEGVFAHEYQHLLHHYTDPDEVSWVNEGLSDFTEVITNYADLSRHVDEKGYEGHTQCYLGWVSVAHPDWNPIPRDCGPENGLTAWEDQGGDEVLADYGNAMYFMNYVRSQGFGKSFFTSWQHNTGNGIQGLESALAGTGSSSTFQSLLEDDLISALIDGYQDNGATGGGSQYSNEAAEATIYFSDEAYASPGAPPWGADYVHLGDGGALTSVDFDGDDTLSFPGGPEWVEDGDYWTTPDVGVTGEYGGDQDFDITRDVSGHDGQVLSFDHYYAMELGWDYGFVQVSTDGGSTYQSLACDGTTSEHDPGAIPPIVAELPGFTGPSADDTVTTTVGTAGAPVHVTCPPLPAGSDYISFRLMTDQLAFFDGWHVKNIQLDGVDFGTDLTGWDNQAFFNPTEFTFGVAFVGINGSVDTYGDITSADSVTVIKPALDSGQAYSLSAADLDELSGFGQVVAVVWGVPAAEHSSTYQPYSLMVNGTEMADGG